MVIYRLGIFSGKNSKELLNKGSENSLRKMDEFTGTFSNEDSLKQYLLENKLINPDDLDKKLSIIYKNNGYINTLPVIYSKEKEYFNNLPMLNIMYSLMCNEEFVEKLIKRYDYNSEYNPQRENINNLRLYLNDLKRDGEKALSYNSKFINHTITDFIKLATNKKDKKNNSYKFNYRGYRDLALFLYSFEKLERLKNIKETIEENIRDTVEEKNDKWILSSEGEPLFPPNSEEEKKYLREQEEELEKFEIEHGLKRFR